MTFKVYQSQLSVSKQAFAKAVADHVRALTIFNGEVDKPRPTADVTIEACIKRQRVEGLPDRYVADYVIEDDTPPPPKPYEASLEERKAALHKALIEAENEAKYKLLPQRKIRLAVVKMQAAMNTPEADRTAEQKEDIASYERVQKTWQQIEITSAQGESDIDDLTAANIGRWKPPTFG